MRELWFKFLLKLSRVKIPWRALTKNDAWNARKFLEDGDLIFVRHRGSLVSRGIPGFYSHAGIYIDGKIYEAYYPKVSAVPIEDFFTRYTHAKIMKPKLKLVLRDLRNAIYDFNNLPYDKSFSLSNDSLYCFEYAYYCYRRSTIDPVNIKPIIYAGKSLILEDSFNKSEQFETKLTIAKESYLP